MTNQREDILRTALRSRGAGTLRAGDAGETVTLCGWIHRRRDHGGLVFFDLRDRWGLVQCVADPERLEAEAFEVVERLRAEDVVRVEGEVVARPEASVNPQIATGEVEVSLSGCDLLAGSETPPFPVDVEKEGGEVAEDLRLKWRFMELRRPSLAANFEMRHRVAFETRRYFDELDFWEVETPMLTRRTPEGARDYLVPSRVQPGRFYALPQSPQLYKQLLMISGFDRYFQIARCFRDEDLRADRQPEFTQIDVEMSFVEQEDVLRTIEGLYRHLFDACLGVELGEVPRLSWEEAMRRFGSDRPDLRIPNELVDVTDAFRETGFRVFDSIVGGGGRIVVLKVPGAADVSRSQLDRWTDLARHHGAQGLVWAKLGDEGWTSSIDKFVESGRWERAGERADAEKGDLLLAVADRPVRARTTMGALRVHLGRERGWVDEEAWRPVWIVEFPLFEEDSERGITPSHHPFTAPVGGLEGLAAEDPLAIKALAYDFVLNGYELGGGSIRIHRRDVQERVLDLLGIGSEEARRKFGFLLDALEYGPPPHGGFAAGLDRTAMLFSGAGSLREVIAFPKTTSASALMERAPSEVDAETLDELHLRVDLPEAEDGDADGDAG